MNKNTIPPHSENIQTTALHQQPPQKWSFLVRLFHWGSALLLLITWAMIAIYENSEGSTFLSLHKAFGVSLLLWTIARVLARIMAYSPAPMPMPAWQKIVASITHMALYGLLLTMPIVGILMTWYAGRSIDMFGLFSLPSILSTDRAQARFYNDLHTDIIWPLILVFTALHIGAAVYHQWVVKDGVMSRIK